MSRRPTQQKFVCLTFYYSDLWHSVRKHWKTLIVDVKLHLAFRTLRKHSLSDSTPIWVYLCFTVCRGDITLPLILTWASLETVRPFSLWASQLYCVGASTPEITQSSSSIWFILIFLQRCIVSKQLYRMEIKQNEDTEKGRIHGIQRVRSFW